MLTQNPNGTYTAYFPAGNLNGYNVNFAGDTNNYSTANGDWLKTLEKGYARMMWVNAGSEPASNPYNYINTGNPITWGIETLTGHNTIRNNLALTSLATLRQNLANAFANNKVVVATTAEHPLWLKDNGLVKNHAYTVVAYNAATSQIRLRNPWGYNRKYTASLSGPQIWRGYNDVTPPNNNGYFWMSLATFQKIFGEIAFEQ